ncbi:MAG TPA: DUF4440 domain-containing protein [Polyangiaceae bacterium]|jgi:hypothetical protein|nr:DUF4440 domain-containing protein [Polyangiaceae bacterium]
MLLDEIRGVEQQLLTAEVRASAEALDRLVSDQFVEFGNSGHVYTKADVIAQMLAAPTVHVDVSDFQVLALAEDVALATYRTPRSLRSSVWRREGAQWRCVFHQGTSVPPQT